MTTPAHDPFRGVPPRRPVAEPDQESQEQPAAATPPPPAEPGSPGQPNLPGSPPGAPGPDPEPPAGETTADQPDVSGPPTGPGTVDADTLVDGEHRAEDRTISDWLRWVGDDPARAIALHNAEIARGDDARSTLLEKLAHIHTP